MTIPIRSVLAAVDLSPISNEVLRSASSLAALTGAELHVVHAVRPAVAPGSEGVLPMQRRIHDARADLRAAVRNAISDEDLVTSAQVVFENGPKAILQRADEVGADVIVIGPHQPRAFGDQVLGSTADRLVRESKVSCLVVQGPLSMPLRRIAVPSDLSEVARAAVASAIRWGSTLHGSPTSPTTPEVRVIHVSSSRRSGEEPTTRDAELEGELRSEINEAVRLVGPLSSVAVEQEVLSGSAPADEILRYIRMNKVDLVVMGTRADHPLVKTLLGSVSAAVAREIKVPFLLVPPAVWKREYDGNGDREQIDSSVVTPTL